MANQCHGKLTSKEGKERDGPTGATHEKKSSAGLLCMSDDRAAWNPPTNCFKARPSEYVMVFLDQDCLGVHQPHYDAFSCRSSPYFIHFILVDSGSSDDILFYPTFWKMGLKVEDLGAATASLVGFNDAKSEPWKRSSGQS